MNECYFLVQISFLVSYFNCPTSYLQAGCDVYSYCAAYSVLRMIWYHECFRITVDAAASKYRVTGAFCPDRRTGGRKHRDVRRPVAHATSVRMRLPHHLSLSSFFQSQNESVVGQYVTWTE